MLNYLSRKLKKKNRGFTLIELIVVIGIIAILAALAIPAIAGYLKSSKERTDLANGKMIYNAANAYLAANPTDDGSTIDGDIADAANDLIVEAYVESVPKTQYDTTSTFTITIDADHKVSVQWSGALGGTEGTVTFENGEATVAEAVVEG